MPVIELKSSYSSSYKFNTLIIKYLAFEKVWFLILLSMTSLWAKRKSAL